MTFRNNKGAVGQKLFDAYIVADWSASSVPKTGADSIWIGDRYRDKRGRIHFEVSNPPTRLEAEAQLLHRIQRHLDRGRRLLVGFDFAFGYPRGTAQALKLDTGHAPAWKAMHRFISDRMVQQVDNRNDRFGFAEDLNARISGGRFPFWGAPHTRPDSPYLPKTKTGRQAPSRPLPDQRRTEIWIQDTFSARPKSVWQLAYTGAVGSQVLLGLPTLTALRAALPDSRIWPFETGFQDLSKSRPDTIRCVLAEVYPSTVATDLSRGQIRDAAQVRALSDRFFSADKAGFLAAAFGPPRGLQTEEIAHIETEEGWILAI